MITWKYLNNLITWNYLPYESADLDMNGGMVIPGLMSTQQLGNK